MYSVTFSCPASRANKQGVSKIQMWLNVGGVRKTIVLDLSTNPNTFNKELNSKRANAVNTYCNNIRNTINTIFATNPHYTASEILECFKGGTTSKVVNNTIGAVVKKFLKIQSGRVDVDFTIKTYNKYRLTLERFLEFIDPEASISTVTNSDVICFNNYLSKTFDTNTVAGYLKRFKTFLSWCVDNQLIPTNPFRQFKIKQVVREVEYLTAEEVERIANKDFGVDRLNKVRDLFVFACNTGLAFCDLSNLSAEDIAEFNGVAYIKKERMKTGVKFTTILNATAMAILTKYHYSLPLLSNQRYNSYLKEIADICNIGKPLHTHIARHTFATMALSKGYNIMTVKTMCGHSNVAQTQHYAKLIDSSLFEEYTKIEGGI